MNYNDLNRGALLQRNKNDKYNWLWKTHFNKKEIVRNDEKFIFLGCHIKFNDFLTLKVFSLKTNLIYSIEEMCPENELYSCACLKHRIFKETFIILKN